jgi:hypothetical protein
MSKETEKEVAALMAQCESALTEYSNRTGASIFSEAKKIPVTAAKAQAVSEQALKQIAKTLELSSIDTSERVTKLEAKLASKANDLEALKLQRKTLENEQEQARQADLTNKRKSMYRTPDSQTKTESDQGQSSSESIIQGENVVLETVTFGNLRSS